MRGSHARVRREVRRATLAGRWLHPTGVTSGHGAATAHGGTSDARPPAGGHVEQTELVITVRQTLEDLRTRLAERLGILPSAVSAVSSSSPSAPSSSSPSPSSSFSSASVPYSASPSSRSQPVPETVARRTAARPLLDDLRLATEVVRCPRGASDRWGSLSPLSSSSTTRPAAATGPDAATSDATVPTLSIGCWFTAVGLSPCVFDAGAGADGGGSAPGTTAC